MKRTLLVFLFTSLSLLVTYTNCSVRHLTAEQLASFGTSCTANLRAKPLLGIAASVCDDTANYSCVRRIFQPGLSISEFEENSCFNSGSDASAGAGEKTDDRICVHSQIFTYNTEAARAGAGPHDFDLGGPYNREEVQCSNSQLLENNVTLVSAESNTVESALALAMKSCRDRRAQ